MIPASVAATRLKLQAAGADCAAALVLGRLVVPHGDLIHLVLQLAARYHGSGGRGRCLHCDRHHDGSLHARANVAAAAHDDLFTQEAVGRGEGGGEKQRREGEKEWEGEKA